MNTNSICQVTQALKNTGFLPDINAAEGAMATNGVSPAAEPVQQHVPENCHKVQRSN